MSTTIDLPDDPNYNKDDYNLNGPKTPNKKRGFGERLDKNEERARYKRLLDKAAGERIAMGVRDRIKNNLPLYFNRVEGYFLWNKEKIGRYRVNVLVNNYDEDSILGATKIAQSYFVVADGDDILKMEMR